MDGDIDIVVAASYENLALIRGVVRSYFDSEYISEKDCIHLIAVIDELATNVIEHAYKGMPLSDEEKKLRLAISLEKEILDIEIEDFGQGYKEGQKSKDEGGMGLNIVKGFADKFSLINKERGCKVLISKKVKKEEE